MNQFSDQTKYLKRKITLLAFHGQAARRRKKSEYGLQLKEKQKAKYTYGVLERQFSNLFKKASAAKGITGEVLLQLLESRLDNVVFRLGLAASRSGARQLVSHRHITVNGEIVNIPSYQLRPGDIVGVRRNQNRWKLSLMPLLHIATTVTHGWNGMVQKWLGNS